MTPRYCLYGPVDGFPVVAHNGTPSTRLRRPDQIQTINRAGVRVLMADRPGYGGSPRRPGRSVADVVDDVRSLADAVGWERFAVFGGSGGGPHALACAALLPGRVVRCAVLSGISPSVPAAPVRRAELERIGRDIMDRVAAGGPEMPGVTTSPARDDPAAMERLRATFVDGLDGWVDDKIAFTQPWGFDVSGISVPVGIWYGTDDRQVAGSHAEWLLSHIPSARGFPYEGGHVPGPATFSDIYTWLRS